MKKIIAAVVIVALVGLYIYFRPSDTATAPVSDTTSASHETTNPGATSGGTPPPVATDPKTGYKDGSYTGKLADAVYGPIQVKAVIAGGRIVDVVFLKYPSDHGHTLEVSQQTMPVLKQEVITIQSANVDTISGATQTVDGFKETLQSALTQAKVS